MASILVVCTGNVCRSPLGEGFLRRALAERLGEAAPHVRSAGTAGWDGSPAMPESVEAGKERGIDVSAHVARRVLVDEVAEASVVVCMAGEHRDAVASLVPSAADRVFTLKELVRLLEAMPPPTEITEDAVRARLREAADLRASGFEGNRWDEDVVDPLGLPLESYRAIAWELDGWSDRLAAGLLGPVRDPLRAGEDR
jgi:protein-tyrosine-phosphatase